MWVCKQRAELILIPEQFLSFSTAPCYIGSGCIMIFFSEYEKTWLKLSAITSQGDIVCKEHVNMGRLIYKGSKKPQMT